MKTLTLLLSLFIFSSASFAVNSSVKKQSASYPAVSIRDIQYSPPESLAIADSLQSNIPSRWTLQLGQYVNDTVTVTAVCVVPGKVITFTQAGFTMLLSDTGAGQFQKIKERNSSKLSNYCNDAMDATPWAGVFVRASSDTTTHINDGFLNVQCGDIIRMTGVVTDFPLTSMNSATQFQPIPGIPIEIIGSQDGHQPISVTVADFYNGLFPNGTVRYSTGEQYEGVLVEMTNVKVSARVNTARGTFMFVDEAGNSMTTYDASRYFTLGHGTVPVPPDSVYLNYVWPRIQTGTVIDTIRGFITTVSGGENPRGYRLAPIYRGDIIIGYQPPLVTSHRRYPVIVPSDSTARITCIVREGENPVNAVQLFYRVNYGVFQPLSMAATSGDTLYEAVIPQQSVNSFVNYFIKVADDNDSVTILASSATDGSQLDTSKGFFFYTVLNRALTIADIQYTPFLNGRSGYIGAVIPVSGFVTADTAHLRSTPLTGGGTSTWYIQDSSTAWNGIWVVGAESLLASTKNNDNITVTGTIQEQFSVTRIGAVSNVVINSTGNPLRNPISLTTGTFGPSVGNGNPIAEPFEGGLVALDSVTVTNVFPTFADPTEYEVDDGTGPIIVRRDGKNTYSNVEADTIFGYTILRQGDKIGRLVGVMYFANNRYKIVPRTNSDFIDVMHVGVLEREQTLPEGFVLHQNYPNPFNPSSNIRFAIASSDFVSLKIFDVLGREVATLVNETLEAGTYTAKWNATGVPSGMYFYRLSSGTNTETKKMVLLK